MRRSINNSGLLFASISAIIGSGWLFACYYAASLAGPLSLLAWLVSGGIVICIAFVFAELCVMLPITGSSARIAQFTHGSVVGFIFAWIVWLSYMALAPTETQAVIQYLAFYFPSVAYLGGKLTHMGLAVAAVLMVLISVINIYSLRWLMRCNSFLTVLKIIIPVVVAAVIIGVHFGSHNVINFFAAGKSSIMPYGWQGMFAAIASGGIVFAFNGFKQAAEMAGEAKNPRVALPFAIIGSVVVCLIIFMLLQTAFLAALRPENLISGWRNIILKGGNSPLTAIIHQDKLSWLVPVLYIGAIFAPLAAALMYCNSASRSLYGMSKHGYVPHIFQRLSHDGNPIVAIGVNFLVGMCIFLPLPGWDKMVTFLSSLMAITYGIGPIALLVLRYQLPDYPRLFKLPCGKLWALVAFYFCNLFVYWSGWDIIFKFEIAVLLGFLLLVAKTLRTRQSLSWRRSIWLWVYFIGLGGISYLGNFGGGSGFFSFGMDFLVIAVFSALIAGLALICKLPKERVRAHIDELHPEVHVAEMEL